MTASGHLKGDVPDREGLGPGTRNIETAGTTKRTTDLRISVSGEIPNSTRLLIMINGD